jgi:DNA (cytosine-5)-methyltransferase 1
VDIKPQPRYAGDEFIQADAMTFWLTGFDAVHASPPCQDHSTLSSRSPEHGTGWMLAETVLRLGTYGVPFVVENVPGSGPSMGGQWVTLCGSSFGLKVRRHRLFRSNVPLLSLPCNHSEQGQPVGCYGGGTGGTRGRKGNAAERAEAMGIDWMTVAEMSQAIPPAYTEFIGTQLLSAIEAAA